MSSDPVLRYKTYADYLRAFPLSDSDEEELPTEPSPLLKAVVATTTAVVVGRAFDALSSFITSTIFSTNNSSNLSRLTPVSQEKKNANRSSISTKSTDSEKQATSTIKSSNQSSSSSDNTEKLSGYATLEEAFAAIDADEAAETQNHSSSHTNKWQFQPCSWTSSENSKALIWDDFKNMIVTEADIATFESLAKV